jgi:hypothetical protein
MNKEQVASELLKMAKSLVGMTEKSVQNRIDKVNKYIAKANQDDVWAIEPDSTWEEPYEFEPVKMSGKNVIFKWKEPVGNGKKGSERINYERDEDDLKWQFNWVLRAIRKGYKSEGKSAPKF